MKLNFLLAKLFGIKRVGIDGPTRVTAYVYKNNFYITKVEMGTKVSGIRALAQARPPKNT